MYSRSGENPKISRCCLSLQKSLDELESKEGVRRQRIAHCGANRQLHPPHPFFPARSAIDYRRQPILIGASQNTRAREGRTSEGVKGKLCDLSRGCFTLCSTDIGVLDILRVY